MRDLLKNNEPELRQKAEEVADFGSDLDGIVEDMECIMAHYGGWAYLPRR